MTTQSDPCVSVLIVNYGTPELTTAAADSALEDPEVGEVVMADNRAPGDSHSLPALAAYAARHPHRVNVVAIDDNLGFGAGTNRAATTAKLPYLFFLNSDAILQPGALRPLLDSLSDPTVGMAAPAVYRPDGRLQPDACGVFPTPGRILARRTRVPCTSESPDWLSGVAVLVRRSEFVRLGGFDERMFMYYEDVELCWRYRHELGLTMRRLTRGVGVVHRGGASEITSAARRRVAYRSQDYFLQKAGFSPAWRWTVRLARFFYAGLGR